MRRLIAAGAAALGLAALGGALYGWSALNAPHAGWDGPEVVVDLPRGSSAGAMFARLSSAGVLRHPRLLAGWAQLRGSTGELQAGEYRFGEPLSALELLERLRQGDVLLHAVTLPEGLVLEQIAAIVAGAGFGSESGLLALFHDPAPVLDLDPDATDLEGYLFPETYLFPRGEAPERIVAAMVERFRAVADENYRAAAERVGLTLRQAVVLASMIEEETSVPEERGRISRTFHNRLARNMRLQCDPTVLYAHHRAGKPVERLLTRHLELDSPWNTYVVRGLPAGPICSPGLASLRAAVDPPPGDELYFVAKPDGGHTFSATLAEHQRAVAVWRRYARSSR